LSTTHCRLTLEAMKVLTASGGEQLLGDDRVNGEAIQ
jgi:hypothetical protein